MTNFIRGRAVGSSSTDNTIVDLTGIGVGGSNSNNSTAKIFCEFCDVPLIKKMDDPGDDKRYICCKCGSIKDPLKVAELDMLKRGERGQTIRSLSYSEGTPFVKTFNRNTDNDKDSLRKGTQVSRALQRSINNDPEPNEEENMRSQNNMRILRTETTYPESGRKIVRTYYDD